MTNIILPAETYIELTVKLADAILCDTYLDVVLIEDKNGDTRYTEEAQNRFEEHLEMVEYHLSEYGICKEDDQAYNLIVQEPDEAQEWHDFNPDC
jgi:hypothetical protein